MVEISSSGSGEGPERVTFPAYSTRMIIQGILSDPSLLKAHYYPVQTLHALLYCQWNQLYRYVA